MVIEEPPVGHVVFVVERLATPVGPPQSLRLPRRMSRVGLMFLAFGLTMLAVLVAAGIVALWTTDTPGSWFNAVFTVMGAVFVVGSCAGYVGYLDTARDREKAERRWAVVRESATVVGGTVLERDVRLSEDGWVSGFDLYIKADVGHLSAAWHPGPGDRPLLQTQVPGVGSPVRLWHAGSGEPLVVEVADPTVVDHG